MERKSPGNRPRRKTPERTKTIGKTITRETISFMDFDNRWNCFSDWFQPKGLGQEIDSYYKDGEITLNSLAQMLFFSSTK